MAEERAVVRRTKEAELEGAVVVEGAMARMARGRAAIAVTNMAEVEMEGDTVVVVIAQQNGRGAACA